MEEKVTENALTLGLGFHQFDGNVEVKDVIKSIGADFEVRKDKLVRLPEALYDAILRGEPITIPQQNIIESHQATVCVEKDMTIGVVGKDYGVIQNNDGFDILNMMCNAEVNDNPLKIVSAGLVHDFEPYIQAELPTNGLRVDGDVSETKFYVFAHTSHDGSSGLQIRFSPVRVVCRNTFMANVSSKLGLNFKHTKYVGDRVDLTCVENIEKIREQVKKLHLFTDEYINQMNFYKSQKIDDRFIKGFLTDLFIDDKKVKEDIIKADYNFKNVETLSTRSKNTLDKFANVLYSDDLGQSFASGTKLWLFNATTNYFSNVQSFGSNIDNSMVKATKRFDAMLDGSANKRINRAMELLAA